MADRIKARYFSEAEFRRCTPPCSLQDMRQDVMTRLDNARHQAGIPFVLNSAYRSRAYELSKGRSGNSAHTRGYAVDIRCQTMANRKKVVQALLDNGFNRIGIAATYVHADFDPSLTQDLIWLYDAKGGTY